MEQNLSFAFEQNFAQPDPLVRAHEDFGINHGSDILGSVRDLPDGAVIHPSVLQRIEAQIGYNPSQITADTQFAAAEPPFSPADQETMLAAREIPFGTMIREWARVTDENRTTFENEIENNPTVQPNPLPNFTPAAMT